MSGRGLPTARVLSIGDELVRGVVVDANGPRIARELEKAGCRNLGVSVVGDEVSEGTEALSRAIAAADVVVVTGGLGPTLDDRTRSMVSAACGVEMRLDEDVAARIRAWLAARDVPERPGHLDQALVPVGATVFGNPAGTAPGFALDHEGTRLYVLPGVPVEMEAIWREGVGPDLVETTERLGGRAPAARSLRVFGVPESTLSDAIRSLDVAREVRVGITADRGIVTLHLAGEPGEEGRARVAGVERAVLAAFGDSVFGTGADDLARVVVRLLADRGETLATAESCTGGLLASMLTDVAGVSSVFLEGAVTYSNEAKIRTLGVRVADLERHGAVSEVVAGSMADGIVARAGTDAGIGITGVAGPGGGTPEKPVGLVYVGVRHGGRTTVDRLRWSGTRAQVRIRSALHGLDRLRRMILAGSEF